MDYKAIEEKAISYSEYRELCRILVHMGKTTGNDQSEAMVNYSKLNQSRMEKWDKRAALTEELDSKLKNLKKHYIWLTLTEAWCGDAAQNLPFLSLMAEASHNIELCLVLRDDHPELMDRFTTEGARSIPKLICLDAEDYRVLSSWGPRPEPAQQMLRDFKANPEKPKEEFYQELHLWYARDKGLTLQQEFLSLLNNLENT